MANYEACSFSNRGAFPLSRALIALLLFTFGTFSQTVREQAPNLNDPSTIRDFQEGDKVRQTQSPKSIVRALRLSAGDWAADVGAGDGYYSMLMSTAVGKRGKVFAEDIWEMPITWLKRRVTAFGLSNILVTRGKIDDPGLPQNTLSAALVVDTYHHFTHYDEMDQKLFQALRPNGRLVIADYSLGSNRNQPRSSQMKVHGISPDIVEADLRRAGFKVLERRDPFVKRMPNAVNGDRRITAADM